MLTHRSVNTLTMPASAPDTAAPPVASSAQGVTWNLADLYPAGAADPALKADQHAAHQRAAKFAETYRMRINTPGGPPATLLAEALAELEALTEQADRPAVFAHLQHAAATDTPAHGALVAATNEARSAINKLVLFFELEWCALPDETALALIADDRLARHRHYLVKLRAWKPYQLSEPEEKILDEKHVTGRAAFVRLFDETVASLRYPYWHDGQTQQLTQQTILAKLYDGDRYVRRLAAEGVTTGLRDNARLLSYLLNAVVADHKSNTTLRGYPSVMTPRNLANEIPPASVEALMTAVEAHHPTVHRYYRLKKRLLGLPELFDYDRYAPIGTQAPTITWNEARQLVIDSYAAFSPRAGEIVGEFFTRRWIDAEVRPAKRGGAFASSAVPSAHPYILMSYTDRLRDVMTLAHELGHGLHQYLSRQVGHLLADTPLTTAEMASVFGEFLTFERLRATYSDPRIQLELLCSKIDDTIATVFRQVTLTRFEQAVHAARRDHGEQSPQALNELWLAANRPMFGDSLTLTEGYGHWWSYIGHFIHTPFYCYAYAYGELLVLALLAKYRAVGPAFVPKYLNLLSRGGSQPPHVLLADLGVDVNDPNFWNLGLGLVDEMVADAEKAVAAIG